MRKWQWNPWHGCHKCSPGCLNCYVYFLDNLRGKDASIVTRSKTYFDLPLKKDRYGNYKIPSGNEIATCFTSDFFIEEADEWRKDAWDIIRKRSDVNFLICTKRIERFNLCVPEDWGDGYENVIIAVTCENQNKADERLPILLDISAKHKYVFVAPILEKVDLSRFLCTEKINLVSVGGESYENARICDFSWICHIKDTCDKYNVTFDFHQTGSNFIKDGRQYKIKHHDEYSQAKKGMEYLKQMKNINNP
ncbi:MAG: phage Gp37/Gp68 family protein [Ruminococcus sp.]|nr:phage Gp37/Gp68 family protein [Ruminococcus sp.]